MELDVSRTIKWIKLANEKIQMNKDYLTTLDQPIGDGDHGINMARGFQAVVTKLDEEDYQEVSDVLKDVAMTIMSKVGGASGPLFATVFLKLTNALKGEQIINQKQFAIGLNEAVSGLKQRGKATDGEKTMVDVWSPIADLFQTNEEVDHSSILQTASNALEKVKEMMATKGRASYFKEKSIGHLDPGAVSSYYIFEALAEVWKGASK